MDNPIAARSKLDKLGIGAKVLELRKSLTCEEVADIVNSQYLPAGVEPLNKMTISRYCVARGLTDMDRNDITKGVTRFNALAEAVAVKNRIVKHINKLSKLMDEIKDDEEKLSELASISNAYMNAMKQLQSLNESVSKIQAEQLRVEKIRIAITLLLKTLDKYPAVKAEFFSSLRENDEYDIIRSL